MQKVYLLLRNNSQSGPFSIDELMQHDLKPIDLVWEEGKSVGWSYPHEIASLKSFFHADIPVKVEKDVMQHKPGQEWFLPSDMDTPFASKSVTSKNVYVSLPHHSLHGEEFRQEIIEETLEQKAEAIRRRALASMENKSSQTEYKSSDHSFELETKFTKTASEIGEDYSAWLYTRQIEKKRKARKRKSFLMGLTTVFFVAIGFVIFKARMSSSNDHSTTEDIIQEKQDYRNTGMTLENTQPEVTSEPNIVEQSLDSAKTASHSVDMGLRPIKKEVPKQKKSPNPQMPDSSKPLEANANEEIKSAKDAADNHITEKTPEASDVTVAPKQKETLGNKIENFFGIFSSKEKNKKQVNRKSKAEHTSAERGVTKRTDESAPTINLENQVNVTANVSTGNWMMGVQGLKLTLHNKSNEIVKTATVEVRYYNDQKDLLEKKIVQFNNVSPKRSQTVTAPDHRLADHADYELVSAIAKEDGYVKQ